MMEDWSKISKIMNEFHNFITGKTTGDDYKFHCLFDFNNGFGVNLAYNLVTNEFSATKIKFGERPCYVYIDCGEMIDDVDNAIAFFDTIKNLEKDNE